MAKQRNYCEASIARVYAEHVSGSTPIGPPAPVSLDTHCEGRSCRFEENGRVCDEIQQITRRQYPGARIDMCLWRVYKRAVIGGESFTAGEPMTGSKRVGGRMFRCGSVVTLVRGGRSLYAWVVRFLSYDKVHVAHVRWLPIPEYPMGTPVVVRIADRNPKPVQPRVVSLDDIDPSPVSIMYHEDTSMYMLRMNGIDTLP